MAVSPTPPPDDGARSASSSRSDRSPVNWLLAIPVVACLVVPVFNRESPKLFGIPFFYWFQLAVIPVGVLMTVLVYRASLARRDRD